MPYEKSDEDLPEGAKKLPRHAKDIYMKAHNAALKQYKEPEKRRGGKSVSREEVAHKVAWAAVKKEYKKEGEKWVEK